MIPTRWEFNLFLINSFCILWVFSGSEIEIPQGKLVGTIQLTKSGRKFSSFLGIPYGEPPIGELRFRSPVPAKPWNGVRMADKDGNACPQSEGLEIIGDEDCLFLNVFTPLLKFNSMITRKVNKYLLPVMVWIHGGAFMSQSSNSTFFNPGFLLDKNIILVTMNYRLGILGFLSTGDETAPGNFGMKDQVLALKWVQKNIRYFGGDPNQVTLFGESAGAASVSFHAFSDASTGLFHQYITQSGSALHPWAFRKRFYFKPFVKQLAIVLGCPVVNSKVLVECLRRKRVDQLLTTSSIFGTVARFAQLTWVPTDEPESKDAFLTDSPENLIAQNKVKDYPLIVGSVINEGLFMAEIMYSRLIIYNAIRFGLDAALYHFSSYYLKPRNIFKFTSDVKRFYFKNYPLTTKDEFIRAVTRFVTDGFFMYPEMNLVDTLSNKLKSPSYFYCFSYQGTSSIYSSVENNYGDAKVGHADEIPYLFPRDSMPIEKTDKIVSNLMVDLWTSFAINGKPKSNLLKNPNLWTPYKYNQSYLLINGTSKDSIPMVTLEHFYFPKRMQFWQEYMV